MGRPSDSACWKNWFRFRYEEHKDTPSDIRNVLLIVAAMVTAVTFQAGVNPRGGVWQDDSNGHKAGRAIYASHKVAFYVFLISNKFSLSASILVLVSLTHGFPFHFEIWVAMASMYATYASAVFAIAPGESVHFRYVLLAAAVPFIMRFVIQLFKRWK
ncbi:uncharacterized protein LOC132300994 [Cornus florida]|uniref:uncharacterized protein LOC132300994 n=1 Tax=Cornus florida TaxID=4283 RepID=UPI0028982553|nr:uncharacterized protein LOC132300994 [Cornus florida]